MAAARPRLPSSWRWNDIDEFREHVNPRHINEVDYVRHAWTVFSWANSLERYFESLDAFLTALQKAEELMHSKNGREEFFAPMNEHMLDIGHHGEMILLYRKRLANTREAQDFIHGKEFIHHAAHTLHRPSHKLELERLVQAAFRFRDLLCADKDSSDNFIVDRVRDVPENLRDDFYVARDLFSVGFDDSGLFATGRGLEKVCREILRVRKIMLQRKELVPAHAENLHEVVEILAKMRWKTSDLPLLSTTTKRLLHWMRDVRNDGAHGGEMRGVDAYELAPVVANTAAELWRSHAENAKRRLSETTFNKAW